MSVKKKKKKGPCECSYVGPFRRRIDLRGHEIVRVRVKKIQIRSR